MTSLKNIKLFYNQLTSLPESIGNLVSLELFELEQNQLTSLPKSILKIEKHVVISDHSYQINNLDFECNFLIFCHLHETLENLPFGLKVIRLDEKMKNTKIKLPFGCKIEFFNSISYNYNDDDLD